MKIEHLCKLILSIPKTVLFNFRAFPVNIAMKLPIFIAYNVKTEGYFRDRIIINGDISKFMIRININEGSAGINNNLKSNAFFKLSKNSKMIFNGKATFSRGISIRIEGGKIEFGKNFECNRNCCLACNDNIQFGDDVLIGWNVNFRDNDGHKLYDMDKGELTNSNRSIKIGNQVWIASYVDILKGSNIKDNCVVGYRSCVIKEFNESNCVIAGYPAKIVKRNIEWKK